MNSIFYSRWKSHCAKDIFQEMSSGVLLINLTNALCTYDYLQSKPVASMQGVEHYNRPALSKDWFKFLISPYQNIFHI